MIRGLPHINQMAKPSNKGMRTPLSNPFLPAITILMIVTAGKRNYLMMVSRNLLPVQNTPPLAPPLLVLALLPTIPTSRRSRPLCSQTRFKQMLPPRQQPSQSQAMLYNHPKVRDTRREPEFFVSTKQEVSMSDNPLRCLFCLLTSCNTRRLALG